MFIRLRRRLAWKCHLDWKSVSTKDPLTNRRHTTRQTNEEGERERERETKVDVKARVKYWMIKCTLLLAHFQQHLA